jgi:glycosyltransferase involved in cell wall biosynthesis
VKLSVVVITYNEESNIGRTLASVSAVVRVLGGEIVVVDSGSSDRTVEIARACGASVFVEEWKGFAAQKNSAIARASGAWILSLDADEEVTPELAESIRVVVSGTNGATESHGASESHAGYTVARKNLFLGKWIRHGGFWPDRKLRLFRQGAGRAGLRPVHETIQVEGMVGALRGALIHYAYPTLADYIEHMNRYSSLGAGMAAAGRRRGFSVANVVLRPMATFLYNYVFRLGFLDGAEGLLLHLYHAGYVSWKYAKRWEAAQGPEIAHRK